MAFGIFWDSNWAQRIEKLLKEQRGLLMGLKESYDNLVKEVGEMGGSVGEILAVVQQLRDQAAGGTPVTPEQLDALATQLDGFQQAIEAAKNPTAEPTS